MESQTYYSILKKTADLLKKNIKKEEDKEACLRFLSFLCSYNKPYEDLKYEDLKYKDLDLFKYEESLEDFDIKDWRIKAMTFRNLRMFPEHIIPYGVRFAAESGQPCSTFLVGKNSNGKSTIFDAIEYFYARKISNADMKEIPKDRYQEYLTYGFGRAEDSKNSSVDVILGVHTQQEIQDYNLSELKTARVICPPAMFISENDIIEIGKYGYYDGNIINFFYDQLRYNEIINSLKHLQRINSEKLSTIGAYQQQLNIEIEDVKALIKDFLEKVPRNNEDEILKECESFNDESKVLNEMKFVLIKKEQTRKMLFEEHWRKLLSNAREYDYESIDSVPTVIKDYASNLGFMYSTMYNVIKIAKENPNNAIENLYNLLRNANSQTSSQTIPADNEQLQETLYCITQIHDNLIKVLFNIVNDFGDKCGRFIEDCINQFSEEGETYKLSVTGDYPKNELRIHISVNKEGVFPTEPCEYLNTFRFKIYAISVKLALAFWYMQENHCILPIVLDDVFNTGDFENSNQLQQFVSRIYNTYHNLVDKEFKFPLQLIMFTHDEQILNAFRKGILTDFNRSEESLIEYKKAFLNEKIKDHKIREEISEFPLDMRFLDFKINSQRKKCYSYNYVVGRLFHYKHTNNLRYSDYSIQARMDKRVFVNLYLPINSAQL